MKFIEFITSNKVVSITTGYLLAGAIREFLESLHDDTIYPVVHGVLHRKKIKIMNLNIFSYFQEEECN
jgi:large-conductance mechanosensitive channel